MPSPYTQFARTLSQIIDDTLRLCGDFREAGSPGRRWDRGEVEVVLKHAILELARNTGVLKDTAVIELEEDVTVYSLPDECMRLLRVSFGGKNGYVLFPTSITEVDLVCGALHGTGAAMTYFREFLSPDEIGILPAPSADGSAFTGAGTHPEGFLRDVTDEDGDDATITNSPRPIRRMDGERFRRSGPDASGFLRDVKSRENNVEIDFIRYPRENGKYPDQSIPEWIHPKLKYLVAFRLLSGAKGKVDRHRKLRYRTIWNYWMEKFSEMYDSAGPMEGMTVA